VINAAPATRTKNIVNLCVSQAGLGICTQTGKPGGSPEEMFGRARSFPFELLSAGFSSGEGIQSRLVAVSGANAMRSPNVMV